jgi:hypothetical protein
MSIDLSRPLVSSMGQHDPLDGLITYLELQRGTNVEVDVRDDLAVAIADLTETCRQARWATEDPLGIGGLLDDATRLARLIFEYNVPRHELLHQLLAEAALSLQVLGRASLLRLPAAQRLPFRELGLSIGVHGLRTISRWVANDRELTAVTNELLRYLPLAEQIEAFWSDAAHQLGGTWTDHRDINTVMLATSLAPAGYLHV